MLEVDDELVDLDEEHSLVEYCDDLGLRTILDLVFELFCLEIIIFE